LTALLPPVLSVLGSLLVKWSMQNEWCWSPKTCLTDMSRSKSLRLPLLWPT
jgi:hypothetical protein